MMRSYSETESNKERDWQIHTGRLVGRGGVGGGRSETRSALWMVGDWGSTNIKLTTLPKNINDSVSHQAIGPKVEAMKTYNNNVLSEPKPMTRCCHQSWSHKKATKEFKIQTKILQDIITLYNYSQVST
jgi:hypothetical protein